MIIKNVIDWITGELIRKISGLNGDVVLTEALTVNTKGEKLEGTVKESTEIVIKTAKTTQILIYIFVLSKSRSTSF